MPDGTIRRSFSPTAAGGVEGWILPPPGSSHGDSELGVNDMNPGWSPAHERAATLPFDGQAASARLDARQTAKERRPSDNSTAASPLVRFLYWIYERRLLNQLKQRPMPRHVGIILDGNRRHARKRGLSDPYEIYQRGAEKLDHILDWCANLRIPAVTLWVFSTENLKRSQAEVSGILSAIEAKVAASNSTASIPNAILAKLRIAWNRIAAASRPPINAPTRKAKSAVKERATDSPDTCAVANARSTIFPVMFAVKTCPSDRKLTASTRPVTAVIPSSA